MVEAFLICVGILGWVLFSVALHECTKNEKTAQLLSDEVKINNEYISSLEVSIDTIKRNSEKESGEKQSRIVRLEGQIVQMAKEDRLKAEDKKKLTDHAKDALLRIGDSVVENLRFLANEK